MNSPSLRVRGVGRPTAGRNAELLGVLRVQPLPAAELRCLATNDAGNLRWQLAAEIHTRSSESEGQPSLCPGFLAGPWQTRGPSRLLCGLYGIISRDGTLSGFRRSAWSPRSGTPSGTLAAVSPPKLCHAVGPGSGAESAVLRGK